MVTTAVEQIDYAARWRDIIEARRAYMDDLYARVGRTTANFWASRAGFFRPSMQHQAATADNFLKRVLERVTPDTSVLDVGAGGGRYAIPLAAHAREVVAVEPAGPMVETMREEADAAGVANLRIVNSDWLAATVEPADVVVCSHVLYPIADVAPFLTKLDAHTKGVCFLYLNAGQPPWEDPDLWLRFHDEPMRPQPTYIDAYNLLVQLGIHADVEIVSYRRLSHFAEPTLEAAAAHYRETLILDDTPETTAHLQDILRDVLVETEQGWSMPMRESRAAIISWTPSRR
ncbi:MAG: class I SAM-dependent methyltransferase [Chloroflexi bacterium]|nr:class I SAM-dependent methyltransferase [Chloroflexota bacterium]